RRYPARAGEHPQDGSTPSTDPFARIPVHSGLGWKRPRREGYSQGVKGLISCQDRSSRSSEIPGVRDEPTTLLDPKPDCGLEEDLLGGPTHRGPRSQRPGMLRPCKTS